jgi:formylmethanofuran dehydrogenase subunit D
MEYQIRKLTISSSQYIQLWPSGHLKSNSVPFIRLQGLWLRELGFNEGDKITIWSRDGQLIITPQRGNEHK